ncbi:porin family protein [Tardiphaga alba]|uniref:Porin family protein n=1 Tax=Tardiphaga alba TaxID=340268 RepID=A0ABX8A612_9BRAD|nr:outer membrane beta-barrel protein [Tardiphaga alba]QUS39088.1 porin family protein [Tardiphaga alba]
MRRILWIAAVTAVLAAQGAVAADMAVPASQPFIKTPRMSDPRIDWSGFYAGVNIGYGWGRSSTDINFIDGATSLSASSGHFDLDGINGGGQVGYNWQRQNWVIGLQADIQGARQSGNFAALCLGSTGLTVDGACTRGHRGDVIDDPALPVTLRMTQKIDWFGTVRGRLGTTVVPHVLVYGTGGLAYGGISTSGRIDGVNISDNAGADGADFTPATASFSHRQTRIGWTAGAGIEAELGNNWSAALDYLYVDLGTVSGTIATPVTALSGGPLAVSYSSHVTENMLRLSLNYRFGAAQ